MNNIPNILTIAGSDSGGGAGIQADLKTVTVLNGFGLSVVTSLTAQNGLTVSGVHPAPADFVLLQLSTVLDGFSVNAAKTGMLCNKEIIEKLSVTLQQRYFPLVVDPVCVSQSGCKLLEDRAIDVLREKILPVADLLTPNLPEAEELCEMKICNRRDIEKAGAKLQQFGAKAVLLKGGHFNQGDVGCERDLMTDWLFMPDGSLVLLEHERIATSNNHGTGCTLSAAIATFLGYGLPLEMAIKKALQFLLCALRHAYAPGKGAGPVHHVAGGGYPSTSLEQH